MSYNLDGLTEFLEFIGSTQIFVLYCSLFWAILGCTHVLFLSLISGPISGETQGTIWTAMD